MTTTTPEEMNEIPEETRSSDTVADEEGNKAKNVKDEKPGKSEKETSKKGSSGVEEKDITD